MGAPYRGELLIVDDMPDNLRLLSKLLREHGYKVRPARNGPQALAAVDGSVPDLVLLDINMPGMDGYEVCRRLKSTEHAVDLPILFLTAMDSVEHKIRGFQAGGVDYITKPFQQEEVLLRVETHLTLRSQRQQLEAQYTRLRQLEEMREGLVQMIAHDIKAPLQSILGFSQLLVRLGQSVEDPRVGRYGRIIDNGARTVLDMVQAMLDVSRLEEGQMPLEV
ncbi:MAG: response regulator, partial [Myxococcota bacterium]